MTRGSKKVAEKRAAYDETMAAQPTKSKKVLPNWMRHRWDVENDRLKTSSLPGFMPRPNQNWHREGSLDEIEQRENAGQRSLF